MTCHNGNELWHLMCLKKTKTRQQQKQTNKQQAKILLAIIHGPCRQSTFNSKCQYDLLRLHIIFTYQNAIFLIMCLREHTLFHEILPFIALSVTIASTIRLRVKWVRHMWLLSFTYFVCRKYFNDSSHPKANFLFTHAICYHGNWDVIKLKENQFLFHRGTGNNIYWITVSTSLSSLYWNLVSGLEIT